MSTVASRRLQETSDRARLALAFRPAAAHALGLAAAAACRVVVRMPKARPTATRERESLRMRGAMAVRPFEGDGLHGRRFPIYARLVGPDAQTLHGERTA
jgi:hypothetical protein